MEPFSRYMLRIVGALALLLLGPILLAPVAEATAPLGFVVMLFPVVGAFLLVRMAVREDLPRTAQVRMRNRFSHTGLQLVTTGLWFAGLVMLFDLREATEAEALLVLFGSVAGGMVTRKAIERMWRDRGD